MSNINTHTTPSISVNLRLLIAVNKAKKSDPTNTLPIAKAWEREFNRRFRRISARILDVIARNDGFGINNTNISLEVNKAVTTPKNQFMFSTTQEKVDAFMKWLKQLEKDELINTTTLRQLGQPLNTSWLDTYITSSYKRGLLNAKSNLNKARIIPRGIGATMDLTDSPLHMDRVGVLYSRAFTDLKGITETMDTQISRVLGQGLIDGDNPKLLARKLVAVIEGGGNDLGITDTLGRFIPAKKRAAMLARTETVRAHHQAIIQEYTNWGVAGVTVQAEWSTAGDGRVCPQCKALEGRIFPLTEIINKIPVHPNCRCMALPIVEPKTKTK